MSMYSCITEVAGELREMEGESESTFCNNFIWKMSTVNSKTISYIYKSVLFGVGCVVSIITSP